MRLKTARGRRSQLGQPGDLLFQHLLVGLQLLDLGLVLLPELPHLLPGVHYPEFPEVPWHDYLREYKILKKSGEPSLE